MKSQMTILVPFIFFSLLLSVSTANVPPNATFRYVNEGFFDEYTDIEYGATHRSSSEPKLFASPFVVCFYNTTPGVYTLALRMGGSFHRRTTLMWVWEANRGKPVGENAIFALQNDGNLILTHADGRLAWHTNTAHKGVTGFKLLRNGNMVLHDANGNFVWQSFDFPTDTLLVGQALHVGTGKLVSRLSDKDNKDGPYTLAMESKGSMSLYLTGQSSLLYYASADFSDMPSTVKFEFELDAEAGAFFFTLGPYVTARAYHNSSLSFLRLGIDGNLKIFTYNEGIERRAFITAYTFFARDIPRAETECQLPGLCGGVGVCEDSQCVACPSDSGHLLGWSRSCRSPRLTAGSGGCKASRSSAKYYKLEGVDHFVCKYAKGEEGIGERECGNKCSLDCKCVGYFYHREISTCWLTQELGTLTRVPNSTHVGYIKTRAWDGLAIRCQNDT